MTKYLYLWRLNFSILRWESAEMAMLIKQLFAVIEDNMKKGIVKDWGMFLDGTHGYAIREGDGADLMKGVMFFAPWIEVTEVHEILGPESVQKIYADVIKAKTGAPPR